MSQPSRAKSSSDPQPPDLPKTGRPVPMLSHGVTAKFLSLKHLLFFRLLFLGFFVSPTLRHRRAHSVSPFLCFDRHRSNRRQSVEKCGRHKVGQWSCIVEACPRSVIPISYPIVPICYPLSFVRRPVPLQRRNDGFWVELCERKWPEGCCRLVPCLYWVTAMIWLLVYAVTVWWRGVENDKCGAHSSRLFVGFKPLLSLHHTTNSGKKVFQFRLNKLLVWWLLLCKKYLSSVQLGQRWWLHQLEFVWIKRSITKI